MVKILRPFDLEHNRMDRKKQQRKDAEEKLLLSDRFRLLNEMVQHTILVVNKRYERYVYFSESQLLLVCHDRKVLNEYLLLMKQVGYTVTKINLNFIDEGSEEPDDQLPVVLFEW